MQRHLLIAAACAFTVVACAPEPEREAALDAREEGAYETPDATDAAPADRAYAPDAVADRPPLVDEGPDEHLLFRSDDVAWQEGPPSLEPGAQFAVLEGDPSETGVFTMRIRMPDGYVIAPHWHPNVERVTVVSGVFHLGSGTTVDRDAAERLDPGSYTSLPPEMEHFAIAEGETVVQLTSVGPWQINYVDATDDPRQRD